MVKVELQQRLAEEYRYAANKISESKDPNRILYYFSIYYGEAQRVLNFQWDPDLALIHMATHYIYTNARALIQSPNASIIPFNAKVFFDVLAQISSDIAGYYETGKDNTNELHDILRRIAKIGYTTTGNGAYLYERGIINFNK